MSVYDLKQLIHRGIDEVKDVILAQYSMFPTIHWNKLYVDKAALNSEIDLLVREELILYIAKNETVNMSPYSNWEMTTKLQRERAIDMAFSCNVKLKEVLATMYEEVQGYNTVRIFDDIVLEVFEGMEKILVSILEEYKEVLNKVLSGNTKEYMAILEEDGYTKVCAIITKEVLCGVVEKTQYAEKDIEPYLTTPRVLESKYYTLLFSIFDYLSERK